MGSQMELAKNRLFNEKGLQVSNVKLFSGNNRDATADQMAEQVNKSIAQIEAGDFDEITDFCD